MHWNLSQKYCCCHENLSIYSINGTVKLVSAFVEVLRYIRLFAHLLRARGGTLK